MILATTGLGTSLLIAAALGVVLWVLASDHRPNE